MKRPALFQGVPTGTARGQRGREFEAELDAANDFYELRRVVKMFHHQQEWGYIHFTEYNKLKVGNPALAAITGDGRTMKRLKSNIDYSGGNGRQSFAFDAKETQSSIFPLGSVHEHQVIRLRNSVRCGMTAGLMIKFIEHDRVFFVEARELEDKFTNWKKQTRAKRGTGSFSLSELEGIADEIPRDPRNGLWDWFLVLQHST